MKHVAIIGAGISGLASAVLLKDAAAQRGLALTITVLEKEARPGGKISSHHEDGYLCESGPNGFLDSKMATLELCGKVALTDALMRSSDNARKRFLWSEETLHRLPENALSFFASPLMSWRGKARLAAELFVPPRRDETDETLADFVRRRLGPEALEKLVGPMASGVFAGDPEEMSIASSFPRIKQLERNYGGLIRALLALQRRHRQDRRKGKAVSGPSGPGGKLTSFAQGIQTLVDTLAAKLSESLVLGTEVQNIRKGPDGFILHCSHGPEFKADAVISACPAYALNRFGASLDTRLAELAGQISYAPLAVICCGYPQEQVPHNLNGFGFLVTRKSSKGALLGTLWDSSIFEHRAPRGKVLLRSMVGGALHPQALELPDEELLRQVRESLKTILGIEHAPEMTKIYRHPQAIPRYRVGHARLLDELREEAKHIPGFFFTGNAFEGVGINDCVAAAGRTAERVLDFLAEKSQESAG